MKRRRRISGGRLSDPGHQRDRPVGKLFWDCNEEPALSVKRGKRDEYETVPISYLITQLSEAQKYMEAQRDNKSSE